MARQAYRGRGIALLGLLALTPCNALLAQTTHPECDGKNAVVCLAEAAASLGSCLALESESAQLCAQERPLDCAFGPNERCGACRVVAVGVALCARAYGFDVAWCEHKLQLGCDPVPQETSPEDVGWLDFEIIDEELGTSITEATVTVDGVNVALEAGTAVASTDFGPHQISVTAPGYGSRVLTVLSGGQAGSTEGLAIALAPGAPLEGAVHDQNNRALIGARVTARSLSTDETNETTSDADGRYRFSALEAGTYQLTFSKEGKDSTVSDALVLDGRTQATASLVRLQPGGTLSGRVIDGNSGLPLTNAVVRASPGGLSNLQVSRVIPGGGLYFQANSDASGNFVLGGLPHTELRVVALATGRGATAPVPIDLRSSPQHRGVVLSVMAGRSITGTVVTSSREPVAQARVVATSSAFEGMDPADLRILGLPPATTTDSRGMFTFAGLPDLGYHLYAAPPGEPSLPALLGAGTPVQGDAPVALTLDAYGSVRGRVRFEDASVPSEFSIGSALTSSTFSHPSGDFRLDNMTPGEHHLYLTGPQFVNDMLPRVVTITSGQAADIGEIVVKRGRSITGTVKRDGRPVAGATVSVTPLLVGNGTRPEPSFLTKTALTAADGKFRIDGVHKAPVPIAAWHSTAGRSPAIRIPVGDGDASVELNLNPTGALRGEVYCGATPVSAIVSVGDLDDQSLFSTTSSPDVGYRLDALAPGRHEATAMLLHPRNGGCAGSRTLSEEITAGTTSTLSFTFEP